MAQLRAGGRIPQPRAPVDADAQQATRVARPRAVVHAPLVRLDVVQQAVALHVPDQDVALLAAQQHTRSVKRELHGEPLPVERVVQVEDLHARLHVDHAHVLVGAAADDLAPVGRDGAAQHRARMRRNDLLALMRDHVPDDDDAVGVARDHEEPVEAHVGAVNGALVALQHAVRLAACPVPEHHFGVLAARVHLPRVMAEFYACDGRPLVRHPRFDQLVVHHVPHRQLAA
mmetsp:Transcript_16340/g.48680  ORF Transcript_16340/g.48680 Transcript_16340/m.48680 type:complete len:230 (+) Transcript_16340:2590-3279(+)